MLLFSNTVLLDSYLHLEANEVEREVTRALQGMDSLSARLGSYAGDYSRWDDTYEYVLDRDPAYVEDNYMLASTYENLGVDAIAILDLQGEMVFGGGYDSETGELAPLPDDLPEHFGPGSLLLSAGGLSAGIQGIIPLEDAPMLFASRPVLRSNGQGPAVGVLMMGRKVDTSLIDGLSALLQQPLVILRGDSGARTAEADAVLARISGAAPVHLQAISDSLVAGYARVDDIYGHPAVLLRVDVVRSALGQGTQTSRFFLLGVTLIGITVAVVLSLVLDRIVLSRIERFRTTFEHLRASAAADERVPVKGRDELSRMAQAVNSMLDALAESQAQLRVARDEALEASRLKSQILANVSHDARTPLSVIILRTQLMQRKMYGPLNPRQSEVLTSIESHANQLLYFVNNLLASAQLASGSAKLHPAAFATKKLLDDVGSTIGTLAEAKHLRYAQESDPHLPDTIVGDFERLKLIIHNLATNAVKFTESGTIALRMSCLDAEHWAIEVSDTGIGIPDHVQERVFEAFYQVDGSSTRQAAAGVGLGLSIVKDLVALMEGHIEVSSQGGKGTTFRIVLPLETVTELEGELA